MEAKLVAILSAKVDAFLSGINQAATRLQKFGQQADKFGAGLSLAVSAPLALFGQSAVKAAGNADSLERGLATLEKNATTLEARLKTLTEIANKPGGLGFRSAIEGDINLRTVLKGVYGMEKAASLSTRTLGAFSNAAANVGKGTEVIKRALYGVEQLANTEFPLGEDLNIIKEALPQVSGLLNEAFGTTRSEQLQKMKISSQQVFETILAGLEKLPQATVGITTSIEQIEQGITERLAKAGKSLFKVFDVGAAADKFFSLMDSLIAKFDALSPVAKKVVVAMGAILVIIPPIIAAIGLIAPAFIAGAGAVGALISPLGAVVLAVGVAVAAIINNWDRVKKSLVDAGAWETLSRIAGAALSGIVSFFAIFVNIIQGDWSNMWVHLKNVVYSAASGIIQIVGDMLLEVVSLIQKVSPVQVQWLEITKAGIRGLQDAAAAQVIPTKDNGIKNPFEGFNFFNGSDDPTKKKKAGADPAAAKKALDDYVKAQLETSAAIIESLERTRDISVSLIQDETERKKQELKNQAADRRANAATQIQDETLRAREIAAINKKLAADLLVLEKQSRTLGGIEVKPLDSKQNKNVTTATGSNLTDRKDLVGKTGSLPGVDSVLESFEKAADKILDVRNKIEQRFQDLKSTFESAFSGWNVEGTAAAVGGYMKAVEEKIAGMTERQKTTFLSFAENTSAVFATLGDALGGGFEAFGEALVKGKNPFAAFGKAILSSFGDMLVMIGKQMLKQAAALAALALISGGALTPIMGRTAIAGAALVTAGSVVKSLPALAKGGEAFGPAIALIGDNPNAHIDRELVGPTSTFRKMVREELSTNGGGGVQTVRVIGEISGDKIRLISDRAENERETLRGK